MNWPCSSILRTWFARPNLPACHQQQVGRPSSGRANRRLASFSLYGGNQYIDLELKWLRVAAKCPDTFFQELLAELDRKSGIPR